MTYITDVPKCAYAAWSGCGGKLQDDHIVPVARGGNDRPENFQWACATHNIDKGALTHEEYLAKLDREGPPGSRGARRSSRGRGRPWVDLVAGGRPFKREAFVALCEYELEQGRIGASNARYLDTIKRLPHDWLVYNPDPSTWQGPLNPKNLRAARPEELR
jgi:hypothetical protein